MNTTLEIPPIGFLAKFADVAMVPLMYLVSGTFREKPQRTHRWNYMSLQEKYLEVLNKSEMVFRKGIESEVSTKWPLLFHMPIIGGWRNYVVLEPEKTESWYVGWVKAGSAGLSLVQINGPVKMLIGPEDVYFFGISANDKTQIAIEKIGEGVIGNDGKYSNILLL